MELRSDDGASLSLVPVQYEFPDMRSGDPGDEWDMNWLVIAGSVREASGRSWTFRKPCMTVGEAQRLGAWLLDVAAGRVEPVQEPAHEAQLEFLEPDVAMDLLASGDGQVVIGARLRLESAAPASGGSRSRWRESLIAITTTRAALAEAAGAWQDELGRFPER